MGDNEYRIEWGGSLYDQGRYQKRKAELVALLGGACKICGSWKNLQFDHIASETKSFAIMSRWNRPLDELLPELMKCQLLCDTCHKGKTYSGKIPHGGGKSGRRNCKCLLCKAKRAEYMRSYKKSRYGVVEA